MKNGMNNSRPAPEPAGAAFEKPKIGTFLSAAALAHWVVETVKKMDAPSNPAACLEEGEAFEVTCFMVASSVIGADERRIANLLGYEPGRVAEWARNLRQNGLWLSDGRVVDSHWFDPESGAIGFFADTLVAQGYVTRLTDPVRGAVYQVVAGRHLLETN